MLDYFDIDWFNTLKLDEKNVNSSKKVNHYKLRSKKLWMTSGIQKSIYIKNKLLRKFVNKKDPKIKVVFHEHYEMYRNLLSTLMKQSNQMYYTKYFENNWNNIKNTRKRIKTIISIKNNITTMPYSIEFDNRTITDPTAVSNVFNNYFISIAKKITCNIKFSPKHYTNYRSYTNTNTFFLTTSDKNEISFIISSLDL